MGIDLQQLGMIAVTQTVSTVTTFYVIRMLGLLHEKNKPSKEKDKENKA